VFFREGSRPEELNNDDLELAVYVKRWRKNYTYNKNAKISIRDRNTRKGKIKVR